MSAFSTDPIIAIATAPGRGGIGVLRLSGPDLAAYARRLFGRVLRPRHAHYLPFKDRHGETMDEGLALFFPGPHSYTGEDVLELQGHGGPAVLRRVLEDCLARGADIDTFPAADDLAGSCGGQGAPDVVYRVDVQNRSRLRASLRDADFPVVVYLQRQCGSSELACVAAQQGQPTEVSATVTPGTYFVVVDGVAADNFGAAHLDVRLDDVAALERACNQAPRVTVGRDMRGDTSSGANRFQATCAGNAASNDLVYRLVLTRRQRVRITSEQQYDGAIYLRTSCLDQSTEIACNDDSGDNRHSLIETELDRGTYFLFIDGFAAQSQGAFTFRVTTSNP